MPRDLVLRDDGETVDVVVEEANQADLTANAKRVTSVDSSGNSIISNADLNFTQALENDSDGKAIFIGLAEPGTAKSADSWQIRKITYSGFAVTDIQFAGGTNNFDQVWNDRSSLSYS